MNNSSTQFTQKDLQRAIEEQNAVLERYINGPTIRLSTKDGVAEMEKMLTDLIRYDFDDFVYQTMIDLSELLEKDLAHLAQENPEHYKKIERLHAMAQWKVLNRLPAVHLDPLFRDYFGFFFDYEWEQVREKVRMCLHYEPLFEKRDEHKKQWTKTIAQSDAMVHDGNILVNGATVPSTVATWMKDFTVFCKQQPMTPLLIVEYLNSGKNFSGVEESVKQRVEHLLRFVETLQHSSLTPEGFEDMFLFADLESGEYKIFNQGQIEETGVKIDPIELAEERKVAGLDEHGKKLPFSQMVQQSPLYTLGVESRYAAPTVVEEEKEKKKEKAIEKKVLPSKKKESKKKYASPTQADIPKAQPHAPEPPTQQMPSVVPAPSPRDYTVLAKEVLKEVQLLLPSLAMEKRFLSIVASYFRGVRDSMELSQALRQTEAEGGVALADEQIALVVHAAEQVKQHKKEMLTHRAPQKKANTASSLQPTLAMVKKQMRQQQEQAAQQTPPEAEVEDMFANISPTAIQPHASQKMPDTKAASTQPVSQAASAAMTPDAPRVMNPIDELRQMNTLEFRRLASTPQEAASKLLAMVELLAEESLAKKADGIAAWKSSTLHQLYVSIGNASLEMGVAVETIIAQWQQERKEVLTMDEFAAIADMNQKMRF